MRHAQPASSGPAILSGHSLSDDEGFPCLRGYAWQTNRAQPAPGAGPTHCLLCSISPMRTRTLLHLLVCAAPILVGLPDTGATAVTGGGNRRCNVEQQCPAADRATSLLTSAYEGRLTVAEVQRELTKLLRGLRTSSCARQLPSQAAWLEIWDSAARLSWDVLRDGNTTATLLELLFAAAQRPPPTQAASAAAGDRLLLRGRVEAAKSVAARLGRWNAAFPGYTTPGDASSPSWDA
jgi:hypothetical protein